MTASKRVFDLCVAVVLAILLLPVMAVVALLILLRDGRPVLYVSERMKTPARAFALVKFRTMTVAPQDRGVTGADKIARITAFGAYLRRTRLDELPQLWNVLRGDMSFVGPRPPLRQYVERFPTIYAEVLQARPGITGLATLHYHRHETNLLARSESMQETDAIYIRACIPRKARLDQIYIARRGLCLDMKIMVQTFWRAIRPGQCANAGRANARERPR